MIQSRWKHGAGVALGFLVLLGLAHGRIAQGQVVAGVDAFQLAIPDTAFLLDSWHRGEWPLWTPYERLGQPFAAQLQTQVFYPVRWLAALLGGAVWGVQLELLFHALLACWGSYLAARQLGRSRLASFLAGGSFGVGPLYVELGHIPNMTGAAGWSGMMLAAALAFERRPSWRGGALLALASAGSLLNGSPETWLWQAMVVLLVAHQRFRWKPLAEKGAALGAAFGLIAITVVPALEFLHESVRATRVPDQFLWSSPPATLLGMVWLNADLPRLDSDQPLLGCVFLGTTLVALAFLGLRGRRSARRLMVLALGLAVLSLGERFVVSHLLLRLPPFSLFRYPVKYLVGVAFCVSLASAFGLDRLRAWVRQRPARPRAKQLAVAVLVCLAIIGALLGARPWLPLRQGAGTGLVWGVGFSVAAALATLICWRRGRSAQVALAWVTLAFLEQAAVWTLWSGRIWVPARELARTSTRVASVPRAWEARIQVDVSNAERASLWPVPELFVTHSRDNFIPLRNGEEQVALADGYGPPEPRRWSLASHSVERGFFDLAGVTQYFAAQKAPYPDLEPELETTPFDPSLLRRYHSRTAFPRAFLTYRAHPASDEMALEALKDPKQPLREVVLLSEGETLDPKLPCVSPPPRFLTYQPRRIVLETEPCTDAYLVVTDADFPGWSAMIDGRPSPIRRADFLVRAVRLTPGKHQVEMHYRPATFFWGTAVTLLSLLGLAGALSAPYRPSNVRPDVAS